MVEAGLSFKFFEIRGENRHATIGLSLFIYIIAILRVLSNVIGLFILLANPLLLSDNINILTVL